VSGAILGAGTLVIIPRPIRVEQRLFKVGEIPDRMAFVPGGEYRLAAWARPTEKRVRLDGYFIDKYEVSNREYKEFINAGGYLKKQYWQRPFVKDGRTLSWEEAMAEFKDRTGLPGPRGWSNQDFPEGKAEHPVTDVTWYEAAAYAAFRGRRLPTVFQWEKAARDGNVSPFTSYMPWGGFYPGETLSRRANFDNDGPWPVGAAEFGMSPYGAYNMAGNVAEWSSNETSQGYIATGGAWGDPSYTFARYGFFPGFYSSNKLGFRCALDSPGAAGDQGGARLDIKEEIPVYAASSEADFSRWREAYRYDPTPLDPQIVEVEERPEWRREKITFNGAGGERAIAYLYLPRNFPRPLQVIHFVPGGDVENGLRSLPASLENRLAPFIKSGRAAFGVVTKGYMERHRAENYVRPERTTVEYRDVIVNRITDIRRGLDYLAMRDDLDAGRVAFFGISAGAQIGLVLAAVEGRYRSVFLAGSGVVKYDSQTVAEANPVYFAPHIRPPKLMAHGRYDEDTPLKTQAEPLFRLLREPKRLVLYDGAHVPPPEFLVPVMNNWLDEMLGPVRRE
jgi:eukaryotic-like serine/threonine-protein kinase